MMEDGHMNPLENKHTLDRHLKGMKALRGATDSKEPLHVPVEAPRNILLLTVGTPLGVRATVLAIVVAFFFLLRISEIAKRGKHHKEEFIAQIRDVTFFCKGRLCSWNHPDIDAVELFIRGSTYARNGNKVAGACT